MHHLSRVLAAALMFVAAPAAIAVDLTKIDRSIPTLPQFQSASQHYCLLAFGPEAATRVWLVRDGDLLFIDRNSNGDLTEAGEWVAADAESDPASGVLSFRAGDIIAGGAVHKELRINFGQIDHLRHIIVEAAALLDAELDYRGCTMMLDVELPHHRGDGLGGRVTHCVLGRDPAGFVHWGTSPAEAPVYHFGGAWEIVFQQRLTSRAGRAQLIEASIGTPGLGAGSTVYVGYEKLIPPLLRPQVTVTFPAGEGNEPLVANYELKERCCTINLLDEVKIPDEAAAGTAKVELTLASWPGVPIAPTVAEAKILPFKAGPAPIPLGARLKTRLRHEHPGAAIAHIVFTPDGRQVIAGDYPGGLLNGWDVMSGSQLTSLQITQGNSSPNAYFAVTAGGQRLIAPRSRSGTSERIEQDGKMLVKQTFNDAMREWDLKAGQLLQTVSPNGGRRAAEMRFSPDGRFVVTFDWVNGLYEGPNPSDMFAVSLWDMQAGTHRQVHSGYAQLGPISPAGLIAVSVGELAGNLFISKSLTVFQLPEWTEVCAIPASQKNCLLQGQGFSPDGRLLVGTETAYEKREQSDAETTLKAWDIATGKEVFTKLAAGRGQFLGRVQVAPDGHSLCYVTTKWDSRTGGVGIIDMTTGAKCNTDFGTRSPIGEPVFHPGGAWFAQVATVFPMDYRHPSQPMDDLEQARLLVIETATGRVLEEQVMPRVQPFVFSIAVSPDGKTLATAAPGEVLLWDFSSSPLP